MSDGGAELSRSVPRSERPVVSGRCLYELTSLTERLPLESLFPLRQPVELELGAGDGSFLLEYAARHPERNFLGVERLMGRLRKIDRKSQRCGLENVLGIRIEAAYFLRYLASPGSLAALHVYFPDPWPKKRHHRRRLVNEAFVRDAAHALGAEGVMHLRTDDPDYFAQMQEVFTAAPDFSAIQPPAEVTQVLTDFERDFNARGIPTLRSSWQKTN